MNAPGQGHNSVEGQQLIALIERVERLEEDKKTVSDEIKNVYTEAKGSGYDVKILRKIVSIREQDRDQYNEEQEILRLYARSIGLSL